MNESYLNNTIYAFMSFIDFLACSYGSYGQDCTQTCNDNCDGCNEVNGSCDRGCKPGWRGVNCQERNVLT